MWGVDNGNHKDVAASSEGRISRVWRFWAALWTGLLLALAYVPSALAEGEFQPSLAGIVQGPTPWAEYQAEEYYDGYLVYGANKYNCLIYALGLNPNDFDLVARGKLGSPSKGGKFYEVVQEGYNDHCPAWVSVPFYEGWLRQSGVTPGTGTNPQYLWAFEIYKDDFQEAKQDAITIRDGGSIDDGGGEGGGGGSGGSYGSKDGDYYVLEQVSEATPEMDLKIELADDVTSWVSAHSYDNILIAARGRYNETNKKWSVVSSVCNIDEDEISIDVQEDTISIKNIIDSNITVPFIATSTYRTTNVDCELSKGNQTNFTSSIRNISANYTYPIYTTNDNYQYLWIYYKGESGGSGGGEDDPDEPSPDPWPDPEPDPVSPSPPQLPEPGDPAVPEPPDPTTPSPDPVIPDPYPPIVPDEPTPPTIETGDTYTVDIQGILDAMDEHCIHIQTCLNGNFFNLEGYLGELASNCTQNMQNVIYNCGYVLVSSISDARDYIVENLLQGLYDGLVAVTSNQADILDYFEDFAAWLDEKLDFQFPDSYDDTSVVYWLKRLYYKQGTGTVSRPEDPVTDPFGIGEWLRNLANLLIQALEGLAPGLVGDLLSTIDLLKLKFPFSLPWDIMTILGAFVASPEAPNVEFPCYAYTASGLSQVGTYDIDLDAYSNVMEGVRFVGYLGFMAYTLSLMPKWAETMCEVVGCA